MLLIAAILCSSRAEVTTLLVSLLADFRRSYAHNYACSQLFTRGGWHPFAFVELADAYMNQLADYIIYVYESWLSFRRTNPDGQQKD